MYIEIPSHKIIAKYAHTMNSEYPKFKEILSAWQYQRMSLLSPRIASLEYIHISLVTGFNHF